jgi:low affinity Fe/Cu permease
MKEEFRRFANSASQAMGTPVAFALAVNRDAKALHLKLDELIRSHREARNIFADLEDASEEELQAFHAEFQKQRQQGHDQFAAAEAARQRHFKKKH